ncbi:MAG: hypothetical protein QXT02_06365 [Candidatus Hadarchaeum sp.]|uniref:hypothetical protein n=1 Tax=Candidatus Hadarchaeum sp. TaxID=2883567 RepID=UPI00316C3139
MVKTRGAIAVIFSSIIMIAVLGWVTNTVLGSVQADNDILGVESALATYGPVVVTITIIGLFVLGVGVMLRFLVG